MITIGIILVACCVAVGAQLIRIVWAVLCGFASTFYKIGYEFAETLCGSGALR